MGGSTGKKAQTRKEQRERQATERKEEQKTREQEKTTSRETLLLAYALDGAMGADDVVLVDGGTKPPGATNTGGDKGKDGKNVPPIPVATLPPGSIVMSKEALKELLRTTLEEAMKEAKETAPAAQVQVTAGAGAQGGGQGGEKGQGQGQGQGMAPELMDVLKQMSSQMHNMGSEMKAGLNQVHADQISSTAVVMKSARNEFLLKMGDMGDTLIKDGEYVAARALMVALINHAKRSETDVDWKGEMAAFVQELEQVLGTRGKELASKLSTKERARTASATGGESSAEKRGRYTSTARADMVCTTCGYRGSHLANQCHTGNVQMGIAPVPRTTSIFQPVQFGQPHMQYPPPQQWQYPPQQQGMYPMQPPRGCFNCGGMDHKSFACPRKQPQQQQQKVHERRAEMRIAAGGKEKEKGMEEQGNGHGHGVELNQACHMEGSDGVRKESNARVHVPIVGELSMEAGESIGMHMMVDVSSEKENGIRPHMDEPVAQREVHVRGSDGQEWPVCVARESVNAVPAWIAAPARVPGEKISQARYPVSVRVRVPTVTVEDGEESENETEGDWPTVAEEEESEEEEVAYVKVGSTTACQTKPQSTAEVAPYPVSMCVPVGPYAGEADKIPRHALKLRSLKKQYGKKYYADPGSACAFCKKNGHTEPACPSAPGDADAWLNEWSRALIAAPDVNIEAEYRGMGVTAARLKADAEGKRMNEGNPWLESSQRRDMLRAKLGYWKAIGADVVTLTWIAAGVPIRYLMEPGKGKFKHALSHHEHIEHVRAEHAAHLADGSYMWVEAKQAAVLNPLQVEVNRKGKKRMCADLRYPNGHMPNILFKQESLAKHVPQLVRKGDVMFTTDIEKAYYSVPIREDAWPYLCWEHEGGIIACTILVFGLCTAPFIFTKLLRAMLKFSRVLGVRVIGMIDDFLWIAKREEVGELIEYVRWIMPALGFKLNDKCVWEPSTRATFLGMDVDSERMEFVVPDDKIKDAKGLVRAMRMSADRKEWIKVLGMQTLTGKLMSMELAIPGVRVWTRAMYRGIARAQAWGTGVEVTSDMRNEFSFWTNRLKDTSKNGMPILLAAVDLTINVDASDVGYGAVMEGKAWGGALSEEVLGGSSTLRELRGLRQAMGEAWMETEARGKRVHIRMDSYPAICNLENGGGQVVELVNEVREWTKWTEWMGIRPTYEHVKRELNGEADEMSKKLQQTASLSPTCAEHIQTWMEERGAAAYTQVHVPAMDARQIQLRWNACQGAYVPSVCVVPAWTQQAWNADMQQAKKEGRAVELGRVEEVLVDGWRWRRSGWVMWAVWMDGRRAVMKRIREMEPKPTPKEQPKKKQAIQIVHA